MRRTLKHFERNAEKSINVAEGMVKLAFVDVDLKNSKVVFEKDSFDESSFLDNFDVKSGTWYTEEGWVIGKNSDMCPGMIVSKEDFLGNIMVEITAQMVAPSTHDINIMINGEWDEKKSCRGNAYVAGVEAFWHGNVGFEKSPEYKLTAATPLFVFDPEKEHNIKMGNVDGKVFVLVDEKLCLEINDPEPLDTKIYGKIGFEAYASWWKFKNLRVYELQYEKIEEYYNAEF